MCGCFAIVQAFNGNLVGAAYLVGLAAVLDFFDGFVARLLKVSSAIGKDLDSLADMVTFGIVPGVVMYQMIRMSNVWDLPMESNDGFGALWEGEALNDPWSYFAFFIPVFSALRLAKFNNDTRQSDSFIGVPTPANAILIGALPLILNIENGYVDENSNMELAMWILNKKVLIGLSLLMSFLLVAELPLIALKFKNFGWKGNEIRFVFLILAVLLLAIFQFLGIPFVIIMYVLLSVLNNRITSKKPKKN